MKITFLGTGSPEGMPIMLCGCKWCKNQRNMNKRLRPSVLVQENGVNILLDAGPDIRTQLLHVQDAKIADKIDAVFITHPHFDHIWGLGDLDQLHWVGIDGLRLYSNKQTAEYVKRFFPWVSKHPTILDDFNSVKVGSVEITAIPIIHSPIDALKMSGYVLKHAGKKVVYIPDVKDIALEAIDLAKGADVLIFDGQYLLGKYIEDDDHGSGAEVQKLVTLLKPKKVYFLAFSEHWYKINASEVEAKKLPENQFIPNDFDSVSI